MTPDELRSLAQEATPGKWEFDPLNFYLGPQVTPQEKDIVCDIVDDNSCAAANARLIALAPQLALLCAEMGEALEMWNDQFDRGFPASGQYGKFTRKNSGAALASLDALEKP